MAGLCAAAGCRVVFSTRRRRTCMYVMCATHTQQTDRQTDTHAGLSACINGGKDNREAAYTGRNVSWLHTYMHIHRPTVGLLDGTDGLDDELLLLELVGGLSEAR